MKKELSIFLLVGGLFNYSSLFAGGQGDTLPASTQRDTVYIVEEREKERNVDLKKLFQPELILKAKYELDTENGKSRFSVRNSRIGLKGELASYMSYKLQIELSSEGDFNVLDLYGRFTPVSGLDITLGQCSVPVFNSYTISPGPLMFANRPFIGKYFASTRDIGLNVLYTVKQEGFPLAVEAGVYNGSGINNPQWRKTPSYGGRLLFGSMKGFRSTVKVYRTERDEEKDYLLWGADIRYQSGNYKIEAEIMDRYNYFDDTYLFSSYIQGAYTFACNSRIIKGIEPAARWDAMGYDFLNKGFGVNRITAGINFIFNMKPFDALVRVNYEQYFRRDTFIEFTESDEMDNNKLTLEFLICF